MPAAALAQGMYPAATAPVNLPLNSTTNTTTLQQQHQSSTAPIYYTDAQKALNPNFKVPLQSVKDLNDRLKCYNTLATQEKTVEPTECMQQNFFL